MTTDPWTAAREALDQIAREVADRAALHALDEEPALIHPPYEVRRRIVGAVQMAVVDAILSAPGVQIEEELLQPAGPGRYAIDLGGDRATHWRPVLRLPAQPIGTEGDAA